MALLLLQLRAQQCAWSTTAAAAMSAFDNRQLFPHTNSVPQAAPHTGWSFAHGAAPAHGMFLGRVDPWQVVEARLQEVSARVQSIRRARAAVHATAPAAAAQHSKGAEEPAAAHSVVRPTPPHLVFAPACGEASAHDNPPPPPHPEGVASAPPLPATSSPARRSLGGGDYAAALSAAESVIQRVTTAGTLGDSGGPVTPM